MRRVAAQRVDEVTGVHAGLVSGRDHLPYVGILGRPRELTWEAARDRQPLKKKAPSVPSLSRVTRVRTTASLRRDRQQPPQTAPSGPAAAPRQRSAGQARASLTSPMRGRRAGGWRFLSPSANARPVAIDRRATPVVAGSIELNAAGSAAAELVLRHPVHRPRPAVVTGIEHASALATAHSRTSSGCGHSTVLSPPGT